MSQLFRNPDPEAPEPTERTRKAIFKESLSVEEEEKTAHPSLRSYLSKRIFQNLQSPDPSAQPTQPVQKPERFPLPTSFGGNDGPDQNAINGNQLNSLDTDMSAGLEQYLPTPAIRLRIIKERLGEEIAQLKTLVDSYQEVKNPPPDVAKRIDGLKNRLHTLKEHERKVDEELAALYSNSSLVFKITNTLQSLQNKTGEKVQQVASQLSPIEIMHKVDPERYEIAMLNQQLVNLADVLEESFTSRNLSGTEIETLVTQYDQTIRQVDQIAENLRGRKGVWDKLNDQIRGGIQRLYKTD